MASGFRIGKAIPSTKAAWVASLAKWKARSRKGTPKNRKIYISTITITCAVLQGGKTHDTLSLQVNSDDSAKGILRYTSFSTSHFSAKSMTDFVEELQFQSPNFSVFFRTFPRLTTSHCPHKLSAMPIHHFHEPQAEWWGKSRVI